VTETKGAEVRVTDTDYDAEGRTVRIASPEGEIFYAYDAVTGRHTKTWTTESEWQYEYDVLGRLDKLVDVSAGLTTGITFDAVGNVSTVTVTDGSGVVRSTTHEYDPQRHWLVGVEHKNGSGNLLSAFAYTRRSDGQILQVDETVKQPDSSLVTTTAAYTYDALNRLTKEDVDTSTAGGDYVKEYILDLVGNRTKLVETKEGQSPVTTTNTYNARDQLLTATTGAVTITYSYDSNGSLIMRTDGTATTTHEWDVRGRLVGADVDGTATSYKYTPGGIRSAVTEGGSTVEYIIDGMTPSGYQQVVEERASGVLTVRYTYGPSLDPVSETRNGTTAVYLGDGHSGVRQAIDATTGAVLLVQRFDAFGQTVAQAGTLVNSIGYRGERFDATLGQYYLRARFYDPGCGRFTGMDPRIPPVGDLLNANLYLYGFANPVMYSDPVGLNLYLAGLGRVAHQLIYSEYLKDYPTNVTRPLGAGIGLGSALLPDIVDVTRREIGEIKPLSLGGLATGMVQLSAYLAAVNGLSVTYKGVTYTTPPFMGGGWGPSTWPVGVRALFPGTINPLYGNWVVFTLANANGLILYKAYRLPTAVQQLAIQFAAARVLAGMIEGYLQNVRNGGFTFADEIAIDLVIERLLYATAIGAAGYLGVSLYRSGAASRFFAEMGSRISLGSFTARFGFG
jgi:RHS repeat-associated protein